MDHLKSWRRKCGRLSSAVLLSAALASYAGAQPSSGLGAAASGQVSGTVTAVDVRAGTMRVLSGVGHALRVKSVRFSPGVPLRYRGASAAYSTLTPGCIVRVECSAAGATATATAIELIEKPTSRPQP